MYCKLIATAASFLFVLLLSFPSLGMEGTNDAFKGLEKELVENSGKVALKEEEKALSVRSEGFVVRLPLFVNQVQFNFTNAVIPAVHYPESIFLRYCALII